MEDIDRAIEYCATFDSGFPGRIRGADPAAIAAIEQALGRPSSPEHRRFLERLGVDAAWLDFSPHHADAQTIQYAHERTEGPMPEGYELFAICDDEPFQDLYMVDAAQGRRLELLNTRDGCSYANLAGDHGMPLAESITEYLCFRALHRQAIEKRPFRAVLGPVDNSSQPALSLFGETMAAFGFEPLWFSSSIMMAMAFHETVAVGQQPEGYPVVITLAASDQTVFQKLLELLTERMKLRRSI